MNEDEFDIRQYLHETHSVLEAFDDDQGFTPSDQRTPRRASAHIAHKIQGILDQLEAHR